LISIDCPAYRYNCDFIGIPTLYGTMICSSWTSIETTLELWTLVKGRMRPLFTQERIAASAGALLDGLLGLERHNQTTAH
jgi:hypothetical protein